MSRFSKEEAESRGWVITHASSPREDHLVDHGGDETVVKVQGDYRAEKNVNLPGKPDKLLTEQAHSMGLLLERIAFQEARLDAEAERLGARQPLAPGNEGEFLGVSLGDADHDPDSEDEKPSHFANSDEHALSVITPAGKVSEAEWSHRDKNDTLIVANDEGEAVQVEFASSAGAEAYESKLENEREIEDARAGEEFHEGEQVVFDPADVPPDSPGNTGTGNIILRPGEDAQSFVERKQAEKEESEDARPEFEGEAEAPEGLPDEVAGTDVGLGVSSDLESEQPSPDALSEPAEPVEISDEAVEAEHDAFESAVEESVQKSDDPFSKEAEKEQFDAGVEAAHEHSVENAEKARFEDEGNPPEQP